MKDTIESLLVLAGIVVGVAAFMFAPNIVAWYLFDSEVDRAYFVFTVYIAYYLVLIPICLKELGRRH